MVRLALLLPAIDLLLRTIGFQRARAWLARWVPASALMRTVDATSLAYARRMADLARAVGGRSPWRTTCLRQALAVWLLLRRRQLPAEVRIGVIAGQAPFQAHAWVELDGVALDPLAAAHSAFPPLA